MGLQMDFDL